MTDELMADVYKDGVLAAYLRRDANGLIHFTYRAEYDGPAVATSLPLGTEYTAESIPPFFQNLLPEGYRLDVVSSEKKISKNNTLGLLLVIGSDVPGDVQIIEHGRELYTAPASGWLTNLRLFLLQSLWVRLTAEDCLAFKKS